MNEKTNFLKLYLSNVHLNAYVYIIVVQFRFLQQFSVKAYTLTNQERKRKTWLVFMKTSHDFYGFFFLKNKIKHYIKKTFFIDIFK